MAQLLVQAASHTAARHAGHFGLLLVIALALAVLLLVSFSSVA